MTESASTPSKRPLPPAALAAPPRPGSADVVNFGDLLANLNEERSTLITWCAVALLAAAFYAFVATPIYKADALVQVEDEQSTLPGLDSIDQLLGSESQSATEIEILRSRSILGPTVDKLGLEIIAEPIYLPVVGKALMRRGLGAVVGNLLAETLGWDGAQRYAWSDEAIVVDTYDGPDRLGYWWTIEALGDGKFKLFDRLGDTILQGAEGETSTGEYDGEPVKLRVARLKGEPGTRYRITRISRISAIEALRESLTVAERSRDSGIIGLSLEHPDPDMAARILDAIATRYVRQNVERRSEEAQSMLEFINTQLPNLKSNLERAEAALNEYRSRSGTVDISFEARGIVEQAASLDAEISQLDLQLQELQQRYTEQHPSIQTIRRQMAGLKQQRETFDKQLRNVPETEQEAVRLTRDVEVANELYVMMLNSGQELKVAKAGTVGNVRILDPAVTAELPIKPRRLLIVIIGAILGLIGGLAWITLRRAILRGTADPDAIERETGRTVYATVMYSRNQQALQRQRETADVNDKVLCWSTPNDLAIESLRSLRTSAQFALMQASNNIITISGPAPEVGKTFISLNFAAVLADAGQRVLLIDGDMRRGHLHKQFNLRRKPGLSLLISGEITADEAVHRITDNLHFIATGTIPPNPSELLTSARFEEALETFKEYYDVVVVDTPPILAVTDGGIIARHADTNFIVIKAGQHDMREIKATVRRFESSGAQVTGFVMNAVTQAQNRYGGYGYYHYQYAYDTKGRKAPKAD